MKMALRSLLAVFFAGALTLPAAAPPRPQTDLPTGYLPVESVNAILKKALSPQGRFVILASSGVVRIFDRPENVEAASGALEASRKGPALVTVEITARAGARRIARQSLPQEPAATFEVPIPRVYGRTQIVAQPGGNVTIIPGQPRDFTTRRAAPGTAVNLSPTGYATRDPEVRMSESALSGGVTRKGTGSATLGKPIVLPVSARVAAPAALQEWARRAGAISADEPPWSAAATECVVVPDLLKNGAALQVTPQVVVYASDRGAPPRRVPLPAFGSSLVVQKGAPSSVHDLDPEFYQLFLGAAKAEKDTEASLVATVAVQYLGTPGP